MYLESFLLIAHTKETYMPKVGAMKL